jgi:hypothetical protein
MGPVFIRVFKVFDSVMREGYRSICVMNVL